MPFCIIKGGQEGKGKDRESKRGFHGTSFPLSPRDHSASVGVLGKDRDKSKPNGGGISMMLGTSPAEKVQDRVMMERG